MKVLQEIWIDWCQMTRDIEFESGVPDALDFLIGDKFLVFLEAAEDDSQYRAELPGFVSEIKKIFERWQLVEYLRKLRNSRHCKTGILTEGELELWLAARQYACHHLLIEWAAEWLLRD